MFVGLTRGGIDHGRVLVVIAVSAVMVWVAAPAAKADFIFAVNNGGDRSDADPGDNSCDVAPGVTGEQCSLRAAIEETNAVSGSDAIRFAIPGAGLHRITPDTPLPVITDPVEIDGYSQPGAHPNTSALSHPDNAVLNIELSGQDAPSDSRGLEVSIDGHGTVIRGLVVNHFYTAIRLFGGTTVQGNFLGTNARGTAAVPNRWGLYIDSKQGTTLAGGPSPADRNVISGNLWDGISVAPSHGVTVQGNLIGTEADGVSPLGNGKSGIEIVGTQAAMNYVAANVVAFNQRKGIIVAGGLAPPVGNVLSRNRLFANRGLGIDLGDDGLTPNDPLDSDTGPNELQNFPVLKRAVTGPKATTIQGSLNSTPSKTFILELFDNPPGESEGKRFIGQRTVSTDADGRAGFTFGTKARVPVGNRITATATGFQGSTSEFSAARVVTRP